MAFVIKALTPDLTEAYLDFFDRRAFSDGSPYYPCYCNAFNLGMTEISELRKQAQLQGGGTEGWKQALRESAAAMVRSGRIKGYLAFEGDQAAAWCNANDRANYCRTGEFDLDDLPEENASCELPPYGQIKSVVCFAVSPQYRGRGLASMLLERFLADAKSEGYAFAEGYPSVNTEEPPFTGPKRLFEKAGFEEYARNDHTIVMRKALK